MLTLDLGRISVRVDWEMLDISVDRCVVSLIVGYPSTVIDIAC